MSLLHIGHQVGSGQLEAGLLLALTLGVLWLHVALLGLFNPGPDDADGTGRREALIRRRRRREGGTHARRPKPNNIKALFPPAASLALVVLLAGTVACSSDDGNDAEAGESAPLAPTATEPSATSPAEPTSAPAEGARTVKVVATNDYRFEPAEIEVKAGETIILDLDSTRTFESHTLVIDEIEGVDVAADAGVVGSIEFTPLEPGTYTFYCDVAGHREEGMEGTLIVVE